MSIKYWNILVHSPIIRLSISIVRLYVWVLLDIRFDGSWFEEQL